jgi:hypothetical protein
MTGQDHAMTARRIARAWTMVLRSADRGDQRAKEQWLHEWQQLCNAYIASVEVDSKEWLA